MIFQVEEVLRVVGETLPGPPDPEGEDEEEAEGSEAEAAAGEECDKNPDGDEKVEDGEG